MAARRLKNLDTVQSVLTMPAMSPEISSQSAPRARGEFFGVLAILMFFIAVSLLVATRTPTITLDEPEYTDPAANLFLSKGFTSTLWAQAPHELWCGNVPLYAGILFCFFKILGFGLFQARVANTFLTAAGAFLAWAALRQNNLIQRPGYRLASLALILSGSVSTLVFRIARYDAAMFFICALVFFAASLVKLGAWRYLAVILTAALLPAVGIPMLPYAGLLIVIYFAVYGFRNFGLMMSVASGLILGIVLLVAFYSHFGMWQRFVEIVLPFTALGGSAHQETNSLKVIVIGNSFGSENLVTCFFGNPLSFLDPKTMFDYSAFALFVIVILIAANIWKTAGRPARKLIVFIVLTTLVVPPVLHVLGHYRAFYRWMTYVPLAIVTPRILEIAREQKCRLKIRGLAVCGICFSLFLGVPFRSVSAFPSWSARSVAPLENMAGQIVRPSDIVVCSFKAYYAIQGRAKLVYCFGLPARGEFDLIPNFPAKEVSLLCAFPEDYARIAPLIGGKWQKINPDSPEAVALAKTRYAVDFYRREAN
jgi:hypothetical protein